MLTRYLSNIIQEWIDPFHKGPCQPSEICSRFIFMKEYFFAKGGKAKPAAFGLSCKSNDLSVYRINNCADSLIWHLCKKYVEPHSKKPSIGRADFEAQLLINANLKLNPDGKPHKRHLNVESWPSSWKMVATQLSNQAVPVKR